MAESDLDFNTLVFGGGPPKKDPEPKDAQKKTSKATRPVGRPSTTSKLAEIQQELASILKLALMPALMRDMHPVYDLQGNATGEYISCASVYVEFDLKKGKPELTKDGETLCEALAVIVFDSPFLMKVINSGDTMGKWIKLAMALNPFVMTVYHNHVRMRNVSINGESAVA